MTFALDTNAMLVSYGAPPRLKPAAAGSRSDTARAQAQDFETVFVNAMLQHMFTGIGNDGPLGNGLGVGVWRSLLTEQYAKSFVKAGGLGLAGAVYKSLIARDRAVAGA
jgi:Rod binding domain-containing protein